MAHTHRVYYGDGIPDGVLTILKAFGTELVRVDMKQVGRGLQWTGSSISV
jgi:hypothetical protein